MALAAPVNLSSCRLDPLDVLSRWPGRAPLAMLHSGPGESQRARWSVLARPAAVFRFSAAGGPEVIRLEPAGADAVRPLPDASSLPADDPLACFDELLRATSTVSAGHRTGARYLQGGWIGSFGYELGRVIEPAVRQSDGPIADRTWPLLEMAWCPDVLVHDRVHDSWCAGGVDPRRAASWLDDLEPPLTNGPDKDEPLRLSDLQHTTDPDRHMASIERTLEYIAAGDIFQANLTHRLTASIAGSTRRLARAGLAVSEPWYGAYVEWPGGNPNGVSPLPDRAILSLSPELFLHLDAATRHVTTRPIKGTRPASTPPAELERSEKDAAELNMIIDLMRNDLGRVCEYGSVRVPHGRVIESHPTVHHGVGEVVGRLRDAVAVGDLLRATFPAGSITGAPKIRAMQIIEELESVTRGPYCGAIGWIGRDGGLSLNVAIRTLALSGRREPGRWDQLDGTLDYGVGGGIVADSRPTDEYRETLDKAAVLQQTLATASSRSSVDRSDAIRTPGRPSGDRTSASPPPAPAHSPHASL